MKQTELQKQQDVRLAQIMAPKRQRYLEAGDEDRRCPKWISYIQPGNKLHKSSASISLRTTCNIFAFLILKSTYLTFSFLSAYRSENALTSS